MKAPNVSPRSARTYLVLAMMAIVALALTLMTGPTEADPAAGTEVPTLSEHNALESRVTDLEDRVDALESDPSPTPDPTTTEPTPDPTTTEPTSDPTTDPPSGEFPTPETTGLTVSKDDLTPSSSITTSHDGQVIENMEITGRIRVLHDNVTIENVLLYGTAHYGLDVKPGNDGCAQGTTIKNIEFDGSKGSPDDIPVYGAGCPWTMDRAYIHNVGRGPRLVNDNTISNSYIFSTRTWDGAHRGATGMNGGSRNKLINNVLYCENTGCSAAIPMYGDFAPVDDYLIEHNLIATTGSYCAYGGSLDSKEYPDGSNIRFIDNHWSTRYFDTCGRYGVVAGFERGVRGNEWSGNIWHETGEPVE